jgi:molybdopterin synthase catalytic subunit
MIALTTEPIDPSVLLEQVRSPHAGAVCLFLGTVRDLTGNERTESLDYEAYPAMAERKMQELEADIRARWTIQGIVLVHRLGRLAVSEISVAVAVSAAHRAEAFEACRHGIDTLKATVPIWKKDVAPDGQGTWKTS